MQSAANNVYYPAPSEYDLIMTKYQFHDSGIADEGLSDETSSVGDDGSNQASENDGLRKPSQSYLEIIAEAILKSPNRMMQLYEIYSYFQRKYRYFAEDVNKSWKNSVRHNLSLNECFVKAGRGNNGKGHFWKIHELAEGDFEQGRFRRRRYRQEMRQLQMQNSSMHHQSPYGGHPQPVSSFYPSPTHSYYMRSPPPPAYHAIYSTPTSSSESHPMTSSTPTTYPMYDAYSMPYYPTPYHSMTSSYTSPNESGNFDSE